MGQSTRLYGANIDVFSVGGVSYVGRLHNIDINVEFDTQEGVALQDLWRYPRGIRMSWNAPAEVNVDTAAELIAAAIAGLQLAVIVETGPGATADKYTGNAIITTGTHGIPDGPQVQRVTLTGQGPLVRAASVT